MAWPVIVRGAIAGGKIATKAYRKYKKFSTTSKARRAAELGLAETVADQIESGKEEAEEKKKRAKKYKRAI